MKTAGEILKAAREERNISLDEVGAATKIKKRFLKAIERSDLRKLPSRVATRGFIKNYAEFLELPSYSILAAFKRDFGIKQKKEIVPRGLQGATKGLEFSWTPKLSLVLVIGLVVLALSVYLGYQYFSSVKNPSLEIIQPQQGQEVLEDRIKVVGKTDPDSTLSVNGELVTLSDEGEFGTNLVLFPGENKIIVESTNRFGKKTILERNVFYFDTEK